jgi:hypothetical protein
MPINATTSRLSLAIQRLIPGAALLAAVLAGLGLLVYPGAQAQWREIWPGAVAVAIILLIYGLLGRWLPARLERRDQGLLRLALAVGLAAAAVYAVEIVLEYVLLPVDNTPYGLVEFGLVFLCYLAGGLVAALQTRKARNGVWAALGAALVSTLVWYIVFLAVTYAFKGTPQQTAVFRAEGNLDDFARSGGGNFEAWLVQDNFGAGFYHLLLALIIAAILGGIGGLIGKAVLWRPGRAKPIEV